MEKISVQHLIAKDFRSTEAIKTLRTNLLFSGENIQAVALTSFTAAEGKSTIAFQLAASLAQMGKRVLLMDADLRKGVLASRLQVKAYIPQQWSAISTERMNRELWAVWDMVRNTPI